MPSVSGKQHRFMEAVAHDPGFAKKAGVPQSVGQDFATADKGKSFPKVAKPKLKKKVASRDGLKAYAKTLKFAGP